MIRRIASVAAVAMAIGASGAEAQDRTLEPAYGTAKLVDGFETYTLDLLAGGSQNAASTIGGSCYGFVADAPDLRVFYTAGGSPLVYSVESEADTTLMILDPNGDWICDDDTGGDLNPKVTITTPTSGSAPSPKAVLLMRG